MSAAATTTSACTGVLCDGKKGPETYYVHLLDGDIEIVTDVSAVTVTDDDIVFRRSELRPVIYPRSDVYFTCCEHDQQPPQF